MEKYIEVSGRNEEEAVKNALQQLGLEREDVSVEVLARAKSGFLGFGSTQARVRVTYEVPDEVKPVVETKTPEVKAEPAPAPVEKVEEPEAPVEAVAAEEDDTAKRIKDFIDGLVQHMDVVAHAEVSCKEEGYYDVELVGEDLGAVIGHRGETLDAIQQLTNYTVNRGQSRRAKIHVDAENYRAKREEALQRLAKKVAGKVVKYRKNVMLESMNAYERHVIHTALQEYPDITTYSTGTEPNRRIVVAYAPGEHR